MKTPTVLLSAAFCLVLRIWTASGQVNLTTPGIPYVETFDVLANTGTSSVLPTGWLLSESGTNANTTYTANTGSSTAGDSYSYGATVATDRAFGGLRSGSLVPLNGAGFINNTGAVITSLDISYTGEEWRLGTAGRTDALQFQLSTDATNLTTGNWTSYASLDFLTPNTTTTGARDGNDPANRTVISSNITGLNVPNGNTFFIRWVDTDAIGADDGLAIDDFSLTPRVTTGVSESVPTDFRLFQNYPNPFNPSTEIKFSVEQTGLSTLMVFNILGQEIAPLFSEFAQAGKYYTLKLDGANLPSGMYFYELESGDKRVVKKMLLLK